MIYWMTNPAHGTMPAYGTGEKESAEKLGWTLLNYGPSPERPPKAAPVVAAVLPDDGEPKRRPGRPAKVK